MTTSQKRRLATVTKLARKRASIPRNVFVHWENITYIFIYIIQGSVSPFSVL